MIILEHCEAPQWLSQFRCFDVFGFWTCMFWKTIINYLGYIIKRAKRLLIPMWSFGAVLITLLTIVALVFDKDLLTINYIIESFAMIGVIGYVWIMRVFLLVAMVTLLLILLIIK